jgi:hypothetical protein
MGISPPSESKVRIYVVPTKRGAEDRPGHQACWTGFKEPETAIKALKSSGTDGSGAFLYV